MISYQLSRFGLDLLLPAWTLLCVAVGFAMGRVSAKVKPEIPAIPKAPKPEKYQGGEPEGDLFNDALMDTPPDKRISTMPRG